MELSNIAQVYALLNPFKINGYYIADGIKTEYCYYDTTGFQQYIEKAAGDEYLTQQQYIEKIKSFNAVAVKAKATVIHTFKEENLVIGMMEDDTGSIRFEIPFKWNNSGKDRAINIIDGNTYTWIGQAFLSKLGQPSLVINMLTDINDLSEVNYEKR